MAAAAAAVHGDVPALRPSKTVQQTSKRESQLTAPSKKTVPPPGEICRQLQRWPPSGVEKIRNEEAFITARLDDNADSS